jgi:signal transduction histidine kinase
MRPMLRSLRFRLPAIFLLGFVVAALVAAGISIRFFQAYTRDRVIDELAGEGAGIVQLLNQRADFALPKTITVKGLERAIGGDRIFFVPVQRNFPFLEGVPEVPAGTFDTQRVVREGKVSGEFDYRGVRYLAVARPLVVGKPFGVIAIAKPTSALRSRLLTLVGELALALAGGTIVAMLLAIYFSRRISRPLTALSRAADEVARGRRDVEVEHVPGGGEISHLADRFRDMATQLAEAEELERNFLMTVSHELRTPLTAIQGHVAALREGVFEDEGARDASLEVIGHEAERLGRLVGDVLDLAKLDAHRFTVMHEEVDMQRLVERAYTTFGEEARRRSIDYRQEIRARPVIVSDGDRVLQIISNLLANAFRWTPRGGRIELTLAAENGTVEVDVVDTGPGVRPEERERIFRPFWSRDGSGTGLGLAIARELAVALGGHIELESNPGGGSRFRLVLPAA